MLKGSESFKKRGYDSIITLYLYLNLFNWEVCLQDKGPNWCMLNVAVA